MVGYNKKFNFKFIIMDKIILTCGHQGNVYECFVKICGVSYYFVISIPNYPSFKHFALNCDWKLKLALGGLTEILKIKGEECENLESFIDLLTNLVSQTKISALRINSTNIAVNLRSHIFYEKLHAELNIIGTTATVQPDFGIVKFEHQDDDGRCHRADVRIPYDYPATSVIVECHDIPLGGIEFLRRKNDVNQVHTLSDCNHRFMQLIRHFQPYWKMMDTLDANSWVLEPQSPRLSDTFRRIQISDYCSAVVTFDPHNIHLRPMIEFRGRQTEIDHYEKLLESKLLEDLWEKEVDVHLNLLSLLELECLPMKDFAETEKVELVQPGDCAICFEERLDGQTANQRCDNTLCDSQYHQVCLLKYLYSNLKNVRMKNAISGRCPTCRDTIGCPTLSCNIEL